jgi:hypothetical protein
MPTSVPDHTSSRSSHFGHLNVRWMRRRWKPTEWPVHIVTNRRTRKAANAPQVKSNGPRITAAAIMTPFQIERAGSHETMPSRGSASARRIRE